MLSQVCPALPSAREKTAGAKEVVNEGMWGVPEGLLVFTYTKSTDPKVASGRRVDRYLVVRVDDQELALSDTSRRETNVLHRSK